MTTFVAALHLPYTVQFNNEPQSPRSRRDSRFGSPKKSPPESPASHNKRITAAPIQIDIASSSPYDARPTPIPNLLQSLSSTAAGSAVPPMTPVVPPTPTGEELFFKVRGIENAPLGSPSDPTALPRKLFQHKTSKKTAPLTVSNANASIDGYFALPTTSAKPREKRRSSASERAAFFNENKHWAIEKTEQGNGGLKNAVEAAIAAGSLVEKTWVGTLGFPTDGIDESTKVAIEGRLREDYDSLVAFAKDKDFDGHYNHYCKEILWPVFHYQIPDHPKSKAFLDHSWQYFEAVNRAVAEVIIKDYKRGDTVWVNDYHLLLVPRLLRESLGPDAKIGFFLHVGFPSSEVFRCLAHREKLLEGMLGATMIGFQTEEYARHFLQTCSRLLCVEAKPDGIILDHRFVNVISLPIGIDPVQMDEKRKEPGVLEWLEALKKRYTGKKLFVARDKLDGVRGVRQKLLAFELFLKKNPEWVGKVVLIQVALTTTSIVELQSTVIDIVTRINCDFATLDYTPVVYLHQDITYQQYIALLTVADALVVTSLRDGMNLTSHEFVHLQDQNHAPLILSEFTGSAAFFGGAELSVNPWDHSRCADALLRAITMPDEEKRLRWQRLHGAVMHRTASYWCSTFLEKLDYTWEDQQRQGASMVPRLSTKDLAAAYSKSSKRLFLLDYEGTLASWGSPTSIILTSPQRTLDVLNDLLADDKNVVYIMSSRSPEELETLFHRVSGIGLIAEGGCFLRPFEKDTWVRLADSELPWKGSVREILEYYVERTPGTYIEERMCSYIWHFEKAEDPTNAARQAGDCCTHVNDSCEQFNVQAVPVGKSVLVESRDWTKSSASQKVVDRAASKSWDIDFLMVAGDSRDDELVFQWANNLERERKIMSVTTLKVGRKNTQAKATTTGVAGIIAALQKLAAISFANGVEE